MAVVLQPERKSTKAKFFIASIYVLLTLGALTMVYPFAAMISASLASNYDYQRHDIVGASLYSRADRFMRSVARYFKTFPRDVYPDAPAEWTSWTRVAADRARVESFVNAELAKYSTPSKLAAARENARRYLETLSRANDLDTVCNYDPRDVARFVKDRYGSLDALNSAWQVPHKSFFDVSFAAESKARAFREGDDPEKWNAYLALKRSYITNALAHGDYISRTIRAQIGETDAAALRDAIAAQFLEHGWRDFFHASFANYRLVAEYLFLRGRAFVNTIILVIISILASLTVNPIAAYALSRWHLKATEKIILFLLATTAFPAAVTAIPGFLLIRDLGLLNTFAALILPGVASGMSIFILKGFFDALPQELYEAATIDGANEWTVFWRITLPMTTPILAVNALNSFIHAYSSWEWAFLVCQKESHWTLAVWMYQMSQTFSHQPWCVMAGFVVVSIPTALVFLMCQKVILRGIVLPSMK